MHSDTQATKVRLNIQLPMETRERLAWASTLEGKKISALVRESIEEKLERIAKRVFEEQMKSAYMELAEENLQISEDFCHSDAENV